MRLLFFALCALPFVASAQLTGISVDVVTVHDGSIDPSLTGMTTYRVYADLTNEYDFVSAVFGDATYPLSLGCDGTIFHSATVNYNYANEVVELFFGTFPATEFDSWLTIGADDSTDGVNVQSTDDTMSPALDLFNAGEGFIINDPIGASWFTVYPCAGTEDLVGCAAYNPGAFAGADGRVLLAQITAYGDIYGIFNLLVFPNGDQSASQSAIAVPFSSNDMDVFGCTNIEAENYDATATVDDLSCIFTCTLALTLDNVSSPSCNGENDGLIQVSATGFQGADYFYIGDTTASAQNFGNFGSLVSGTYDVYVVDAAGCIDSLQVEVPVTSEIVVNTVLSSPVSCNGADDAVLTVESTTGGDGDFTYYISTDPTVLTDQTEWTGLAGGSTYVVWAFDGNMCTGSSEPISVFDPTPIIVALAPVGTLDATNCSSSDGEIFLVGGGGNAPTTIQFSVDGMNYAQSPLIVPGGTYTVTAQDVFGCTGTLETAVQVEPLDCTGCTDPIACNYDASASISSDECDYESCTGCTDSSACNYDSSASISSDECDYESCTGCIFEIACNYDPSATIDDGSCVFVCLGCTDATACNFDSGALQNDGTCIYPEDLGWCDCEGTSFIDALGVCGGDCEADDDGDGICDDVDDCVGSYDACGVCNGPGAIYECGCSGLPDGSCDCSGQTIIDQCGVCGGDGESCVGCTYEFACNYDPEATIAANETCEFGTCGGCTDFSACNYNPTVTEDDGSCLFFDAVGVCGGGCVEDVDGDGLCDCISDVNGDGVCDLDCNLDSDGDGIVDCLDLCPWGDFDNDGICDDVDPCVGVVDLLGICNGQCFVNDDGDQICDDVDNCTNLNACNYADPGNDDCSFSCYGFGGSCLSDENDNGICDEFEASIVVELDTAFYEQQSSPPGGEDAYAELEGYKSFVVYAEFQNPTDVLSAIFADDVILENTPPLAIDAPCGCWNPDESGMEIGSTITTSWTAFYPQWKYDSFWTIGKLLYDDAGQSVSFLSNPVVDGSEICTSSVNDGLVYIVGSTGAWPINAIAGDDLRVPIARVTTCGSFSISGNLQLFVQGDQENTELSSFSVSVNFDGFNEGCSDPTACNYDPLATYEDGSCSYADMYFNCNGNCLNDTDGDGICNELEIDGCTDLEACNYDPVATEEDGSCSYGDLYYDCDGNCLNDTDGDGICEPVDPCVGVVDECGICNGPGAIYGCGCEQIPDDDCDCNGNQIDAVGVCGGDCLADENGNGICDVDELQTSTNCGWGTYWNEDSMACVLLVPPYLGDYGDFSALNPCYFNLDNSSSVGAEDLLSFLGVYGQTADCAGYADAANAPWSCGDPVSYQGYDYATVQIGDQCWFAENLRNENYRNGDAIPSNLSDSEWSSTSSGAVAVYGEGSSTCNNFSPDGDACDELWSLNEYGRLYNWYSVDDARGLCPSGWHVPTHEEWTMVTDFLGGSFCGGFQMKTVFGWYDGGNGLNSSGFSGLPGGYRQNAESFFYDAGFGGYWWSASPHDSNAYSRVLASQFNGVNIESYDRHFGLSVRCIKDVE